MTNKILNQLFSSCKKWKTLVLISLLLTLGVGQMWGYETFKEVWVTYNTGGSDQGAAGSSDQSLGNVSQFVIKAFYLNCRDNWGAGRTCWNGGGLYYSTDGGANYTEVVNNATTWKKNGWTEDDYQFRKESMSVTLISSTAASGNYTIKFKGKVWGNHDTWINSGNASTWTMSVLPPALNSFTITPTGAVAGSGTSSDPYIIPYGGDLTLVSSGGSKARTDANSTVQFSLNNSTWGTSTTYTTKTISNVTSTDKASVNLYAKCYNSTASLSGAVKTQTIYYRAAALKTITLKKGTDGTSDGSMTIREYATAYTAYTAATKTNWSLKGYYTDASSGTQIIDKDGNLLSNKSGYTNSDGQWIGGDKTLHAQWKQTYSVTYYANYPTGATSTSGSVPTDATEYSSGATVTVKTNSGSLAAGGFTFSKWNTQADGQGTDRATGSTFSISTNTQLYAKWTENKRNVTISAQTGGSVNITSASVGVATTTTVTATAYPGYRFTGWTATNCSVASTSSASTTLSGNGTAGSGTLVANFARTYAYLEGRMTVYNAARNSATHVGSSEGGWSESSFNVAMDYDETNHYFYRHTYKTPAELKAQISSKDQWFSIARSNASGSWSGKTTYHPSANTDLTTTGSANKKAAQTSTTNYNYKFNSSTSNGYAILYFDEAGVWYELEHSLIYHANYAASGTSGTAPATEYYPNGFAATAAGKGDLTMTNYTFSGWNTDEHITGTSYAVGSSITMNANKDLYAVWIRSIPMDDQDATTGVSNTVYGTYNCTTLSEYTNPEKNGYTFNGWYTQVAGGGNYVISPEHVLQQSKTNWTDAGGRYTRKPSSTSSLYAKWTQTVTLNANLANHGSGSNKSATIVYKATDKSSITHCSPATGYHRVGYYTDATGGTKVLNADGSFASSAVTDYITSSKWTKAGATTLYAQYEVNTYTIHYDPNDDKYVGEATGSMEDQAATWGIYPTLTSNGFTREGYTFAGWATSPTGAVVYSNGQTLSTNLTNDNNATVTLYAKWTPKTYTVTFNARGGSGLTPTSKTVTMGATYGPLATVTPPAGKVFSGWYTSAGGGTLVESTTQVTTASDHTLYAHYAEKAQVYFKNTIGWSQVWVTYDANWDGSQGTGNKGKTYHRMNLVPGTTDVYYDDIPDEYLTSWRWNIAFNNLDYSSIPFYAFDNGEAVFRYDFDKKATLFVPTSNTGSTADGNYQKNGVQYRSTGYSEESSGPKYTSGYWRTYNNTYSGYSMTYQKDGGSWSSGHKMECAQVGDNTFIYSVHMDANSQYNFAFYKERDVNTKSVQFRYGSQITSSACTNLKLVCDPNNAWMQTTVEGDYVFKLEMKNDGHMYLTVEYPFKANDYKVVYSYTKDGAKTYDSEIIRGRANGLDTISVFIHSSSDASSRSLKIAKCTGINASGVPTWNNSYATIDISSVSESGVYDFIITQNGSAVASGAYWNKYSGNYYIRTDASDGGWDMYKYRPDNLMTLSDYSLTQTLSPPYSHYYCRHIESTSTDISYCIATDYSPNISGIMTGDATIGESATTLPAAANVRFSWNEKTNALRRAYLKNAQGAGNTRFLVLHGRDSKIFNADGSEIAANPSQSLVANELLFSDLGNWVYQVELDAQPFAAVSLIANYNGQDRYLIGGADSYMQIMGGTGSDKYDILAVYDFKTNRLMTVWIPSENITESLQDVDVLLIRHGQDAGRTIVFGTGGALNTNKVIGAIEFHYNELVGHVANWNQASREKLMFDVSFPFDVNVSDIFGLNAAYGEAYAVQKYNGEERASKGFFQGDGTTTFWQTLSPSDVMKANVGYTIITDNDYFNNDVGHLWDNKSAGSKIYLYFPSASDVGNITSETQKITVPEHECTIDRTFTGSNGRTMNHKYTDSNWNMMGVPVFANVTGNASGSTYDPGRVFLTSGAPGEENTFHYFYQWNTRTNGYDITAGNGYQFKSMHSYMVQYTGQVWFTGTAPAPAVAARRIVQEQNYTINMQLLNEAEEVVTRTYVELRENACDTFALNEDVCMIPGEGDASIYSFAGNYDVAANVLPIANQVVVLGVEVNKAGKYTFSMPSIFSGKVTLIDNYTGEHVDLSMDDYEVELEKGIISDRFMLEINIEKVTTAIDGANDGATLKDGRAHKFLQNGILYILLNGILYDAQGKRVQ